MLDAILLLLAVISGVKNPNTNAPSDKWDAAWTHAQKYAEGGNLENAEKIYRTVLATDPDQQRAAVELAINLFEQGRAQEAADAADVAIAIDPYRGKWAELAFLYKAKACGVAGCIPQALDAVHTLKYRFPDSVSTTKAELVEAELWGRNTSALEAQLGLELQADDLHTQAVAAVKSNNYDLALQLFDQVIYSYPDTRKSLRSRMMRATLLGLMKGRTEDTLAAWDDVRQRVEGSTPYSPIHYDSIYRTGFLRQRLDMRQEAYEEFSALAKLADDPRVVAEASLQAAGAYFEVLQRQLFTSNGVSPEEWSTVREDCASVLKLPRLSDESAIRAELMVLESFAWEIRPEETVTAADDFLKHHGGDSFLPEQAAAHYFLGQALQRVDRHAESIPHFRWIIETFPPEDMVWDGLNYQALSRYSLYVSLMYTGVPMEKALEPCYFVIGHYPDSEYAVLCRRATGEADDQPAE